jgi:hypothetical protein
MKKVTFLSLFLVCLNNLYAQEILFGRISSDTADNVIQEIGELKIVNTTKMPICIATSYRFGGFLSSDTIELAYLNSTESDVFFSLETTEMDAQRGVYQYPKFPIVINPSTAFVAKVSLARPKKIKNAFIKIDYSTQPGINFWSLFEGGNIEKLNRNWQDKISFRTYSLRL